VAIFPFPFPFPFAIAIAIVMFFALLFLAAVADPSNRATGE